MFQAIREQVNIVEVAELLSDSTFKSVGQNTYATEDDTCIFCGHKGCARIKMEEGLLEESFYHCFSEGDHLDVTAMTAKFKDISQVEAAKLLAKQFNITLPRDFSPLQELMNIASEYYYNTLLESGPCAELGGLTPVEYQVQKRGHTPESLLKFHVGWSNGTLISHLESLDFNKELIQSSGLSNKRGLDFLPSKSFIYPHLVRGRVSHFTFKDPLKKLEYQLPSRNKLNGHSFYNSDSIRKEGPVIIVEGENDVISVVESGWNSGVICCNGSISTAQLDWLGLNLVKRDVITIFDTDPAGDSYREKVGKISRPFNSLIQVKLTSGEKDIDEYLKSGGDIFKAISSIEVQGISAKENSDKTEDLDSESEPETNILEKKGAYYKVRYKDGNEYYIKLTNFVIKLRNIFIRGKEREREIVIIREDGPCSAPLMIPSEAKVSLKPFKTLLANAIDASFYGREEDMVAIWEHVYRNTKETVVNLPEMVGKVSQYKGWLFADMFISDTGAVYTPDEDGVIWISNKTIGVRAQSMQPGSCSEKAISGVPHLSNNLTFEETEDLLKGFIENLAKNLGQPGDALTILGWAWSSVHSEEIFNAIHHVPFLYFWGKGGQGKTEIQKWVLNLFNLEEYGWNTVGQLNSGVSFSRKLSYYSSLPMCIDELRIEKQVQDMYGIIRGWYNRSGRTVSADGFGVKTQEVRSTIIFGGEDRFSDQSTRERCIHVRIAKNDRELVESFKWVGDHKHLLPAIGLKWILESNQIRPADLIKEVRTLDTFLRHNGISSRTSLNWAVVAFFANKLAEKYMPKFNYMDYLLVTAKEDVEKQKEDDTNNEFWAVVEGLQSEDRPKITGDHLRRDGDKLHIWFAEVFRIVQREGGRSNDTFSKGAVLEAIKEEDYFVSAGRGGMGMQGTSRRIITIDLTKAPEGLLNIANFLG